MTETLQVGVAGGGMIGRHHLIAWSRAARTRVVAIADPVRERATERAKTFGVPAVYDDPAEMLEREALAAIDIASPRETHVAIARHAVARGVAILCQKPLAPTLQQARDLVRAAGAVRLMVHENWRFRPYYRLVRRWLEEGRLGTVRQARLAVLSSGLLPDADGNVPALVRQPFMASEERLLIAESLIHHLDVARWLLGPLQVVACRTSRTGDTVRGETMATILLETQRGAPVVIEGNAAAPGYPARATDRLELIGDIGRIILEGSPRSRWSMPPTTSPRMLLLCARTNHCGLKMQAFIGATNSSPWPGRRRSSGSSSSASMCTRTRSGGADQGRGVGESGRELDQSDERPARAA